MTQEEQALAVLEGLAGLWHCAVCDQTCEPLDTTDPRASIPRSLGRRFIATTVMGKDRITRALCVDCWHRTKTRRRTRLLYCLRFCLSLQEFH